MSCARGCCATQREHYLSISVSAIATPTRANPHTLQSIQREKDWSRDMGAYRELRRQGLQPPRIDGSANLANSARTELEINEGQLISKAEEPVVRDVIAGMNEVTKSQAKEAV